MFEDCDGLIFYKASHFLFDLLVYWRISIEYTYKYHYAVHILQTHVNIFPTAL